MLGLVSIINFKKPLGLPFCSSSHHIYAIAFAFDFNFNSTGILALHEYRRTIKPAVARRTVNTTFNFRTRSGNVTPPLDLEFEGGNGGSWRNFTGHFLAIKADLSGDKDNKPVFEIGLKGLSFHGRKFNAALGIHRGSSNDPWDITLTKRLGWLKVS